MLAACRPGGDAPPSQRGVSRDTSSPFVAGSLPPIGLPAADSVRAWCAGFAVDEAAPPDKSLQLAHVSRKRIAGGVGLLVPRVRQAAGVGLVVLLIALLPANVEMLQLVRARGGLWWEELLLWLRLPFQGVLAWWVWRLSRGASRGADGAASATEA